MLHAGLASRWKTSWERAWEQTEYIVSTDVDGSKGI